LIKVSNILSAPFIFDHSYCCSGVVLPVILLDCCAALTPDSMMRTRLSEWVLLMSVAPLGVSEGFSQHAVT
jgi:hypothetical protein